MVNYQMKKINYYNSQKTISIKTKKEDIKQLNRLKNKLANHEEMTENDMILFDKLMKDYNKD